jgi:hypothetical protein
MSLSSKQRYGAFFTGVGLGCVMAAIYFGARGLPHAPEPPPPGVIRRQVPGVLAEMMQTGRPITGEFVLSQLDDQHIRTHDSGTFRRWVVVPGLDPGAFIRIEEVSRLQEPDKVVDWKFMFADQVRAKLIPQADTHAIAEAMQPLGWHFIGGKDKDDWVEISLGSHHVASVPDAVTKLTAWTQWIAQAEPDFLPPPAAPGSNGPS